MANFALTGIKKCEFDVDYATVFGTEHVRKAWLSRMMTLNRGVKRVKRCMSKM